MLALLFSIHVFSQDKLTKIVCDAQTRKGISFATIKVLNKPDGVYANEEGMFVIKVLKSDSLLVSCVGYKPEKFLIPQADTIFLQPIVVAIDEVKVSTVKSKEHHIGYYNTRKKFNMLGGRIQIEHATRLIIPQDYISYRIKKVKINNGNRGEANPVRLHIYSQGKDGLPDKELLTEDIIINNCIKSNDEIDLSRLNLVLSDRVVFVGVEWIEPVLDRKISHTGSISFGFTDQIHQEQTYTRLLLDPDYRWKLFLMNQLIPDPANLMVSLIID